MGYRSVMHWFSFTSDFSAEEITEKFKRYVRAVKENKDLQELVGGDASYLSEEDVYVFTEFRKEQSGFVIEMDCSDDTYKHYSTDELAVFISLVIKEGFWTEVTLEGEDGECWGYEITSNSVSNMEREWKVTGKPKSFRKEDFVKALL